MPMVVAGNKKDMDDQRQVPYDEAADLARSFHCPYLETSYELFCVVFRHYSHLSIDRDRAKTRLNVEEVFFEVVRQIRIERGEAGGGASGAAASGDNPAANRKKKKSVCTLL